MILNGKKKKNNKESNSSHKSSSQLGLKNFLFKEKIKQNNINVLNFITQKNKFNIIDNYDEKNSKKFLESKSKAMSEINLNDELDIELNKKENKKKNKYNSSIKLQYINEKTSDTDNKIEYYSTNKIEKVENNNSNDSNHLYKFILENANETEENFLKKYKKQKEIFLIDFKNKSEKKIFKLSELKNVKKKSIYSGKKQSLFSGQNPFIFSENAKKLMINQNIEASSIKSFSIDSQDPIKNFVSIKDDEDLIINDNFKKNLDNKNNNNINNEIIIDSDKESILNILSGLGK